MELLRLGLKSVCSQKTTPNLTTFEIYELLKNYNLSQYEINYPIYAGTFSKNFTSGTIASFVKNLYTSTGLPAPMINKTYIDNLPDNCIFVFKFNALAVVGGLSSVTINNQIGGTDFNNTTVCLVGNLQNNVGGFSNPLILTKNELLEHSNLIFSYSGATINFNITLYIYDLNK
jgi:hypothetical protein